MECGDFPPDGPPDPLTLACLEQDSWGVSNPDTVTVAIVQLAAILCFMIQSLAFIHRKVVEATKSNHTPADVVSAITWGACTALGIYHMDICPKPAVYINIAVCGGFAAAFAFHAATAKSPAGKIAGKSPTRAA